MKETVNKEALMDAAQDALRALDRERDEMRERLELMDGYTRTLEAVEELMTENEALNEQVEELRAEAEGLRQELKEKEVRLTELSKVTAGVAKKSSQDDVSKALRIYLNTSKRKTQGKREAAKTVILELITAAKLELPDELMEQLEHFDDELSEPKVVNVAGSYNDIHDNGSVGLSEMGV